MKKWYFLISFVWLFGGLKDISAYDVDTHGAVTERAITVSIVDRLLKEELRLSEGVKTILLDGEILKWARNGAIFEDEPVARVLNHFHNPLAPWASAGLHVESIDGTRSIDGLSSVLWQQYPAQHAIKTGGDWAWRDARRRYLTALVEPAATEREQAFADTFLTLGHLMHLVQDVSVPAHTRNDPHLLWDGYESWVERTRSNPATSTTFFTIINGSPVVPESTIFTPTNSSEAPAPIARLIDTDTFDGSNGVVLTGDTIGMAEYTNGNFVSDNTIFTSDFLLPRPQSLGPGFFVPEGQAQRQYFSKVGAGEQVTHFVAEGVWHERLRLGQTAVGDYILTDRVFEDYARKLLPRAVGYSAALLDYFFRGKIDLAADPNNSLLYVITNRGAEDMRGTFTLYYDDVNDERHPVPDAQWKTTDYLPDGVLPKNGGELRVPAFVHPTDPPPKILGEYLLVFEGDIGDEHRPQPPANAVGGVAAKKVNLSCQAPFLTPAGRVSYTGAGWALEPDPTVQYGNTDWVGAGCRRLSWLGPFGRHIHMRHTSQLSNHVFSEGKVIATAPGPVLGAAIQTQANPPGDFLVVVVAEVNEFDRVAADTVYSAPLENPTVWTSLGSFDSYTTDESSSLPYRTHYPTHYFFNASGTQAVSVKRIAGDPENKNPKRLVTLDVQASLGLASFELGDVEEIDTIGSYFSFESPPTSSGSVFYENTYDLDYTAHQVAADYLGDRLMTVDLRVEEHSQAHGSASGNAFGGTSQDESSYTHSVSFSAPRGWSWALEDRRASSFAARERTDEERIPYSFSEAHEQGMKRGSEYIDLRFDPPLVAYEERQSHSDSVYETAQDEFWVVHILRDEHEEGQEEQLAWRINDATHSVYDLTSIPPGEPGLFQLVDQSFLGSTEPEFPTEEEVGTFAVGGISAAPQVVGAHKNPRIERNFMYPPGDLGILGGSPVGR